MFLCNSCVSVWIPHCLPTDHKHFLKQRIQISTERNSFSSTLPGCEHTTSMWLWAVAYSVTGSWRKHPHRMLLCLSLSSAGFEDVNLSLKCGTFTGQQCLDRTVKHLHRNMQNFQKNKNWMYIPKWQELGGRQRCKHCRKIRVCSPEAAACKCFKRGLTRGPTLLSDMTHLYIENPHGHALISRIFPRIDIKYTIRTKARKRNRRDLIKWNDNYYQQKIGRNCVWTP